MHLSVFYIATIWLGLLIAASLVFMIRTDSITTRILVLDTVGLMVAALLALFSRVSGNHFYLDGALLLGLLSFAATVAAARYHSQGKLFR